MSKDLLAEYYQKNKEMLQKRFVKGIKIFSNKEVEIW